MFQPNPERSLPDMIVELGKQLDAMAAQYALHEAAQKELRREGETKIQTAIELIEAISRKFTGIPENTNIALPGLVISTYGKETTWQIDGQEIAEIRFFRSEGRGTWSAEYEETNKGWTIRIGFKDYSTLELHLAKKVVTQNVHRPRLRRVTTQEYVAYDRVVHLVDGLSLSSVLPQFDQLIAQLQTVLEQIPSGPVKPNEDGVHHSELMSVTRNLWP